MATPPKKSKQQIADESVHVLEYLESLEQDGYRIQTFKTDIQLVFFGAYHIKKPNIFSQGKTLADAIIKLIGLPPAQKEVHNVRNGGHKRKDR